jgi:hypothetical protein
VRSISGIAARHVMVRVHAHLQHPQPARPVVLPQRLVPLHVTVAAEDVVDEHVEPAVVTLDGGEQRGDLFRILVVDDEGGARPASGADQVAGLLDGLGPADLRWARHPAAAAGGVHEQAGPG